MSQAFSLEPPNPAAKKRLRAKPGKRAAQRSMESLRRDGYIVGKVEYWSEFDGRLIDLFGFIDLVALDVAEKKIVAVQVTKGHLPEHIKKIQSIPAAAAWIDCGGEIFIHFWRELGKSGAKKWVLEVIQVTMDSEPPKGEPELF